MAYQKQLMSTRQRLAISQLVEAINANPPRSPEEVQEKVICCVCFAEQLQAAFSDFNPGLFLDAIGIDPFSAIDRNRVPLSEEQEIDDFLASL
jgi:hypothetical protein